ncbi:helix-turn-helix domain-containing protein [Fodinicola feengrottensis]|uniref:Helix-turn-helix transcriptional regulator n=1 Tax=Fodinicola feengrottensis TaxID=435914 RepID=A0ABN2INJ8_9ACTN|nr:helix-turn-helix transcriptional regulator [Fodinicola feengrottensis]
MKNGGQSDEVAFTPPERLRDRTVTTEGSLPSSGGPKFSRKRVGEEIRRLRNEAMLSQGQLGKLVRASGARISRLETGETAPDLALVMNILEALKVDKELTSTLILVAREANEQMWWKTSGMPERQAAFAELEGTSRRICEYSMVFFPGLLQCPEYVEIRYADRESAIAVDGQAAAAGRVKRQEILRREGDRVKYTAILDEGLLRRQTAPSRVMTKQLRYLVEMASLPTVDLRVVPLNVRFSQYSPPLTAFFLFDVGASERVAVVEAETNELTVTDKSQVQRYEVLWDRIFQVSLSPEKSIELIQGVDT